MNITHFVLTESALEVLLVKNLLDADGFPFPNVAEGIWDFEQGSIRVFATFHEASEYCAVINIESLSFLLKDNRMYAADIYRRIVRVLKGLRAPPIHLPRQWSEFHHRNFIAFFATPKNIGKYRWMAETDSINMCVRFESLYHIDFPKDLSGWESGGLPFSFDEVRKRIHSPPELPQAQRAALVPEVDLTVIGSGSVVRDRSYEDWKSLVAESQQRILDQPINSSIRIIGPAGSGKTLALCLRAIQVIRDDEFERSGNKLLFVTHSWAMAERIDGILTTLNGGVFPLSITVFPLISLLQLHGGQISSQKIEVIGDDSSTGRTASLEIIKEALRSIGKDPKDVSKWISDALTAPNESRAKAELLFNLREEFTGVLAANALAFDDSESVSKYLTSEREEWMPPFLTRADRSFVVKVYRDFLQILVDRSSVTTDQFVLDTIRVLETFSWRMRKETDGYDQIFIDELQLFDSQERSALHLLGRSKIRIPFVTAEDPSQGIFSALHSKSLRNGVDESVYLEAVHRFDPGIFDLIKFIYQKFPLNTIPLKIDNDRADSNRLPRLFACDGDDEAISRAVQIASELYEANTSDPKKRICLVTLADVDDRLIDQIAKKKISFVHLKGFDDVEQLAYSRRSVIVAPWEFIGGTQFSNVIVLAAGMNPSKTSFGKLRELTSVYLAASRSAESLDIVCGIYVPQIIIEAKSEGLIE